MFKNKLFLVLLLSLVAGFFKAQDVVVLNNGRKIYCRILSVDSASIIYTLPHQKRQFEIKKTEVYKYDQRSVAKVQKTDTIRYKDFTELLIIGLSGGPATPLGEFASQDANSEKSGLAKTGGFFRAGATLKLNDYFGFTCDYHFQSHGFSHELIAQQFNQYYRGNPYVTTSSTKWKIKGFFGGIHLSIPIQSIRHLSFDLNLSGGVPKAELPELTIFASNGITVIQHTSVAKAPAFLGGLGLKYRLQENVAFGLHINYLETKAQFHNIYTQSTNGVSGYDDYSQKIQTLNVQFSVSFIISSKKNPFKFNKF